MYMLYVQATQMLFPVLAKLPLTVNSTPFLFKGQCSAQNGRDLRRQKSLLSLPIIRFFFLTPLECGVSRAKKSRESLRYANA